MRTRTAIRLAVGIVAVAFSVATVALWLGDGAWHYAEMPTRGVKRTLLLGGLSIVCLAAAQMLDRLARRDR